MGHHPTSPGPAVPRNDALPLLRQRALRSTARRDIGCNSRSVLASRQHLWAALLPPLAHHISARGSRSCRWDRCSATGGAAAAAYLRKCCTSLPLLSFAITTTSTPPALLAELSLPTAGDAAAAAVSCLGRQPLLPVVAAFFGIILRLFLNPPETAPPARRPAERLAQRPASPLPRLGELLAVLLDQLLVKLAVLQASHHRNRKAAAAHRPRYVVRALLL